MEYGIAEAIVSYCRRRFKASPATLVLQGQPALILRHNSTLRWYCVIHGEEQLQLQCGKEAVLQLKNRYGFSSSILEPEGCWLSVSLDGSVPEEFIRQLLLASFRYTDDPDHSELSCLSISEEAEVSREVQKARLESDVLRQKETVRITDGYGEEAIHSDRVIPAEKKDALPSVLHKLRQITPGMFHSDWDEREAQQFFFQAAIAKDYEDDYDWNGSFVCFRPAYRMMSNEQLRGYFTWRTRWKKGEESDLEEMTRASFALIRVYEILNGCAENAEEGYPELVRLLDVYGPLQVILKVQLKRWIHDYVIDHQLKDHVEETFFPELEADRALQVLGHPEEADDMAYFDALSRLSEYRMDKSVFLQKQKALSARILKKACMEISRQLEESVHLNLLQKCFGDGSGTGRYAVFYRNAIYHDPEKARHVHEEKEFQVDAIRTYVKDKDGIWRIHSPYLSTDRSHVLGDIIRETDRQLRDKYGKASKLREHKPQSAFKKLIARVIEEDEQEQIEAAKPKIHIDLSSLSRIRSDADIVRDALIINEEEETAPALKKEPVMERQEHAEKEAAEPVAASLQEKKKPAEADGDPKYVLLHALLDGTDCREYLHAHHIQLAMLVDEINETMMDAVGDTVIEFDGDTPVLIEDYREDAEEWLKEEEDNG